MRYATPYTPLEVDYSLEKLNDIEKYFKDLIEEDQIKSVAFAMGRYGKKFVERSLGVTEENDRVNLIKPDALYDITPLTGLVLCASIMALIEDGKLYYETSIVIEAEKKQFCIDDLLRLLVAKKNLVIYQSAWTIINKASGQGAEGYIKKRIFDPCNMGSTYALSQLNAEHFSQIAVVNETMLDLKNRLKNGQSIVQNNTIILSNPSDLIRFGHMIMQNGRYDDREVLQAESVEKIGFYLHESNYPSAVPKSECTGMLEEDNIISSTNLVIHKKEGIVAAWIIPKIAMGDTSEINKKVMDEILLGCLMNQAI